jgi:hypothetical protein
MDGLQWLQRWFHSQCDGDWEHCYGITIETLDNPGWKILINLSETSLENKSFNEIVIERDDNNWIFCKKNIHNFEAHCGALNLEEVIKIFQNWSEGN